MKPLNDTKKKCKPHKDAEIEAELRIGSIVTMQVDSQLK